MPSRTLPRALAPLVLSVALVSPLVPASALVPTPGSPGSGDSILPRKGNGGYDVRHYALDVSWKPQRSAITGTARINAVATQDLSSYNLDLAGLTVREVRVAGRPATFSRSGSELTVTPAVPLDRGQRFKMALEYDGQPAPLRSRALGRTGWIPTKDGATTLSEPVGSETWFPVNNTIRDKATYSFAVDVPNHLKVASNGRLVGRDTGPERTTWRWRESSPMAPYLPMISIGRYKVFRSNHDGLPLVTFVDAKLGRQVQARRALPKVIDFFESKFGRYPFGSSGMVIDKVSVGYALETQSRPVFAGDAPSYLIAHEIAHQWFGNSVTPDDWRHIWLNEGFATYTEWLWDAERYDAPRSAHRQFNFLYDIYGRQAKFWDRPPGDPGTAAHLFDLPVYDRGAMTLHALRLKVGDKAFFATLRAWATRNAGENVSTRDFKLLAERVSGNQLDRLFRAWVYAPSKPKGY